MEKKESPAYFPRANGLAERAVQTVKRGILAWYPGARMDFNSHLERILLYHRTTSKARGRTPAEIMLRVPMRVPYMAKYGPGETVVSLFFPEMNKFLPNFLCCWYLEKDKVKSSFFFYQVL